MERFVDAELQKPLRKAVLLEGVIQEAGRLPSTESTNQR
jgi:hypothetical protein